MSERKKRHEELKERYERKKEAWERTKRRIKRAYERSREEWELRPSGPIRTPKRGRRVRKVKPEPEPSREQLVDVRDEGDSLLITAQISGAGIPKDVTIDEISELTFRHGVLEIRLGKRMEELSEEEEKALEGEEEMTARIKEKVLWRLRSEEKRRKYIKV